MRRPAVAPHTFDLKRRSSKAPAASIRNRLGWRRNTAAWLSGVSRIAVRGAPSAPRGLPNTRSALISFGPAFRSSDRQSRNTVMKVAEAIAHALSAEGVTLAAGITGQSIGHVADSLAERNVVSLIYARQERVAFDICDGFARTCGTPAVMFADAGPAAANATGGLVNSWGDSIPVLFSAGHNDRFELRSGQTKELPFRELFAPVSK